MGPREPGTMLPHCTKTLRWLVIFLKPHPLIMCLKKQCGFSELWVQSLRSMGSECQWAKQRVAKMGFGGFETQAPGPLWSKLSRGYRDWASTAWDSVPNTEAPPLKYHLCDDLNLWSGRFCDSNKHTKTKSEGKAVVFRGNILNVWLSK